MKKVQILAVDLQKDFSDRRGKHYKSHPNVRFIKEILLPFLAERKIKVAEIISDYRQPRPGDRDDSCNPGTLGYKSEIPQGLKIEQVWVKCMNSPIWTRENIGDPERAPGIPFEDPIAFGDWLHRVIGSQETTEVVLIGLTIDCCVLCAAQELSMRGYEVSILDEGVDPYSGDQEEKEQILKGPILQNWAKVITWQDLRQRL